MADKKISALTAASTPLAGTEVLPIVQGGSTVKVSIANVTAGRDINTKNVIATGQGVFAGPLDNFWAASGGLYGYYSGGGVFGSYSNASGTLSPLSFDGSTVAFRTANVSRLEISNGGDVTAKTGNLVVGTANKGIDFSANASAPGMTSELLNAYEEGTWTPTFVNLTVGNATVNGRYTKTGRIVTATIELIFGSTSAWTGSCSGITGLPFTTAVKANGCMTLFQTNVGWSMGQIFALAGQTQTSFPTNYAGAGFAAASPWVWAANDYALITLVYEAL